MAENKKLSGPLCCKLIILGVIFVAIDFFLGFLVWKLKSNVFQQFEVLKPAENCETLNFEQILEWNINMTFKMNLLAASLLAIFLILFAVIIKFQISFLKYVHKAELIEKSLDTIVPLLSSSQTPSQDISSVFENYFATLSDL